MVKMGVAGLMNAVFLSSEHPSCGIFVVFDIDGGLYVSLKEGGRASRKHFHLCPYFVLKVSYPCLIWQVFWCVAKA